MNWEQSISKEIFEKKYCLNGETSAEEVFSGVAEEVASKEKDPKKWSQEFYNEMLSGKLLPGGRILANARPFSKMKNYNNCFTIDVEDSMEGIYLSLLEDAQISKSGGGVGFNISKLRPKGDVLSTGGESSGPISFLRVFNESAKIIMTGGQRRSAHIAIMNIDHPDIEEFITVKKGSTNNELTQFNISVGISDDFMDCVKKDLDWKLQWNGKVYKTVKAKYLYELLAKNAYEHNEPGVLFLDTVERYNNGSWAFKVDRCNPCGEITMPSYSLCCLASLNLTKYVVNPFTPKVCFNWGDFKKSIQTGVRFLDNVLDVTRYPLQKIEDMSKQWRRIGLGFTGLGDMFVMMGVTYGSPESLELSEKIGKFLRDNSYIASSQLAEEKGSFPAFDSKQILKQNFILKLPPYIKENIAEKGLRNIGLNTTAPTGTISLSVGQNCSSGIEPMFSLKYDRNIRTGRGDETKKETVYDYAYLKYRELFGDSELPKTFVTTLDINPYEGIDVQSVFQKYIDHSISKTANLPTSYSFEEYLGLWEYAFSKGLKGFTSFNPNGSIQGILEHQDKKVSKKHNDDYEPRPQSLPCEIHHSKYKDQKLIVLVGLKDEKPYEVFVTQNNDNEVDTEKYKEGFIIKQKSGHYDLIVQNGVTKTMINDIGKTFDSTYGTLSRMVSMSLRHNVPLTFICEQLSKDGNFIAYEKVLSRVLKKYIPDGEKAPSHRKCKECGSANMVYQDGCMICVDCGNSKCS